MERMQAASYVEAFILILSRVSPDTLAAGEPQSDQCIPLRASSCCCIREQGHRSSTESAVSVRTRLERFRQGGLHGLVLNDSSFMYDRVHRACCKAMGSPTDAVAMVQ